MLVVVISIKVENPGNSSDLSNDSGYERESRAEDESKLKESLERCLPDLFLC